MAKKRVIAHFMHERERDAVRDCFQQATLRDGFWIGDVDETDLPRLRKEGLFVRILKDKPRSAHVSRPKAAAPPARGKDEYYLLKMEGPLVQQRALTDLNARILGRSAGNRIRIQAPMNRARDIEGLAFVDKLERYEVEHSGPAAAAEAAAPAVEVRPEGAPVGVVPFDVLLHREEDAASFKQWLEAKGIAHPLLTRIRCRILIAPTEAARNQVLERPEVSWCQRYHPPRLHNDFARRLTGVSDAQGRLLVPHGLKGHGQLVAVADTGLDAAHPDFAGRIEALEALGRTGNPDDPHGHGTHVAGTVLGDGAASGGRLQGVAPQARLFFQSLLDKDGGLGGLPADLTRLFQQAYDAGARIHNNSWGSAMRSHYTVDSHAVDEFVAEHPDMLIVFSAGNAGQALGDPRVGKGSVGWTSIDSPATCKNALVVGASRSDRGSGGLSGLTWRECWPDDFPDSPIGDERVSGNPEALAAFSSRGPCVDYRIRPDLVAPGTDIASARSAAAPGRSFWGAYPGQPNYAFMGGTSMSAPFVAGLAALVREYYVGPRGWLKPSAALLKATLLNGTRWLLGSDAVAQKAQMPNYHQGFGCVNVATTLPDPAAGTSLEFVDTWQDAGKEIDENVRGRVRFQIDVAGGAELRLCLAWTDPPGKALQNDLNLFLEGPDGLKRSGNDDLPMAIQDEDPTNNVELIRLRTPRAGTYLVQITGTSLLKPLQHYALVAFGALGGPFRVFNGS